MRIVLLVLASMFISLTFTAGQSPQTDNACSPDVKPYNTLHIAWIDYQNDADEVIVIFNGSPKRIDLSGFKIESVKGSQVFEFQKTILNEGCCVLNRYSLFVIHSGETNGSALENPDIDLHWLKDNESQPRIDTVWRNDGDAATLRGKDGTCVDTYRYGEV